jgi:hypothetical protein
MLPRLMADGHAEGSARLPARDRGDLAVQALARSDSVSDLADKHGVSRKFDYQQTGECQGSCRLDYAMIPFIDEAAAHGV